MTPRLAAAVLAAAPHPDVVLTGEPYRLTLARGNESRIA
jgi:hypothetical protein